MDRPQVGVGAIVIKDDKVLLGKRMNAHGEGTWCFPGGHLEGAEDPRDCAVRETLEEAGIGLKNLRMGPYTNDIFAKEDKHYITLFVLADLAMGEPKIMEPHKCAEWKWFDWNALPSPLFVPIENLLKQRFNPLQ